MHYRLSHIPALLRTPAGRVQLRGALQFRSWPVLSRLARLYRQTAIRHTRLVAVVGSFGKSSATRAVAAALDMPLHRRFSNNCWSGLAWNMLRIRPGQQHAAVEVGIDKPGQMGQYARLVRPDIVVVTSIGSEHHRSLGTLEATRHQKAEMVRALPGEGVAVLNGDDPNVLWMRSETRARVVTFGLGEGNDVRASDLRLDWPHGTRFRLHVEAQTHEVASRLLGRHALLALLAGVAVARTEGVPVDRMVAALERLRPVPGRLEPVSLGNDIWILRDDHKAALETVHSALDVLAEIPARRRLVALGEVTEPPGSAGPIYRAIGERVASIASLAVVVARDRSRRSYTTGAMQRGMARSALLDAGKSTRRATEILREVLVPGDVVLLKARLDQHFERVALALLGRRVQCDVECCHIKRIACAECPMLASGWRGATAVT
jgi:UDP-N-acetylmuramoyl-tripeptide--D-alanyl-D-alanine ligase